ncbi:MAG: MoxR family ATPase [Candidatus Bipolaricaulota bacterium]|nr:MoxR family ATPase [Candidatus Bipolaricaulota bacterium]MCX7844334.1 MoxR family ATPase [Candidatus Bipolaricaulota bacterium]MDW8152500.1 MoxR family ATPase [Candidatus Bipolaricaulota bacterium]
MVTVPEVKAKAEAVLAEVETVIVGKGEALRLILAAILAGGHVLIEDYPGLAKTLAARLLAQALGLSFRRIQFTPDLLPADILGTHIFRREEGRFVFQPGPIFTQILLADEINRATPKTQAALLEAMQENQATVEGNTYPLPQPFVVLATQNPIEYEGTFPLPEAQVDRFLIRVRFGYPSPEEEVEILRRRIARRGEEAAVRAVASPAEVLAMRQALEEVFVEPGLLRYMAEVVARTRRHSALALGASPRGTLALLKMSRAWAALHGRDFVLPDDVKAVAVPALAHRLLLAPELWTREVRPEEVVLEILAGVPVPKVPA